MHIEKLKYYIDLYECRSFTKAAKKNYISQASLSQFISSLEQEYDSTLFDRKNTPIIPTHKGTIFYEQAKLILKQYEHLQESMQEAMPSLHIGYTSFEDLKFLLRYIPLFNEHYPEIKIDLDKVLIKDINETINSHVYDCILSFTHTFDEEGMVSETLAEGKYGVIVGKGHPLYDHQSISIDELYNYQIIMLSRNQIGDSYDEFLRRCRELDGYESIIAKTVDDLDTEMFYIITEHLLGFVPTADIVNSYQGAIHYIPINDTHHTYRICAGYSKNTTNVSLRRFIESFH